MMAGKKTHTFPTKAGFRDMRSSLRRNGPRRLQQLGRWCRENTGALPKMAQMWHAHKHNVQPSRQATVILVEKYGNGCIRAQDFEGLQGHSGIKDRQTGGKCTTQYPERRGICWAKWVSEAAYTQRLVKEI